MMKTVKQIFQSYGILDAQGRHTNGTDKETNHHYGDAYEGLFPDRHAITLMMEIGVADGSSLLAWRDIFPNALCVGMDIHHADRAHGERIEMYMGDMRSQYDCERTAGGREFDFICEDATHQLGDTLQCLLFFWPFVKPGGLYVVEEFKDYWSLRRNIRELFPFSEVIHTDGPFGSQEALVVLRKPT